MSFRITIFCKVYWKPKSVLVLFHLTLLFLLISFLLLQRWLCCDRTSSFCKISLLAPFCKTMYILKSLLTNSQWVFHSQTGKNYSFSWKYDEYFLDIFSSHISIELNKEKLMKYNVSEHIFVNKDIRTYSS